MWEKPIKKTVFTLALNGWQPEITEITHPLIKAWAKKIGADFYLIKDRKLDERFHPTYEKLQIYDLAKEMGNDWNIYIDSDAVVHPDFFDPTNHLNKDTVCHNGNDQADNRWRYDRFFYRDGRHIGSCNWFTIASDWCIELWKPLGDITPEEAVARIYPTVHEVNTVITSEHLIDDFVLSRNIAMFGLKFTTIRRMLAEMGQPESVGYLFHQYTMTPEEKVIKMKEILKAWALI
jgi:hypothetical protein